MVRIVFMCFFMLLGEQALAAQASWFAFEEEEALPEEQLASYHTKDKVEIRVGDHIFIYSELRFVPHVVIDILRDEKLSVQNSETRLLSVIERKNAYLRAAALTRKRHEFKGKDLVFSGLDLYRIQGIYVGVEKLGNRRAKYMMAELLGGGAGNLSCLTIDDTLQLEDVGIEPQAQKRDGDNQGAIKINR